MINKVSYGKSCFQEAFFGDDTDSSPTRYGAINPHTYTIGRHTPKQKLLQHGLDQI